MVPTTYTELFIFLLGAVGAAMFFGTGAALLRLRRTGVLPGRDPAEPSQGLVRGALVRCALGAIVVVSALAGLSAVRA